MLTLVGEVEPEHLHRATRSGVLRGGVVANHVTTERDGDVLQGGVAADPGVLAGQVHGVVGPVLQRHHSQLGAVLEDELDVVGEHRASPRTAARPSPCENFSAITTCVRRRRRRSRCRSTDAPWRRRRRPLGRDPHQGDTARLRPRPAPRSGRRHQPGTPAQRRVGADAARRAHPRPPRPSRWCAPSANGASSCRPRRRLSGVNRQISSRPVGTGWSLDVERAIGVQMRLETLLDLKCARQNGCAVNRLPLPSAARSAG